MPNLYLRLADLILAIHFLFIEFVIVGQVCIVMGYFRHWQWVRHLGFRVSHLIAIAVVVIQAWLGKLCPLTIWESALREAGGGRTYDGTFIEHWVGRLIYYDMPAWWFTVAYSAFGAVVVLSWVWVRPRRARRQTSRHVKTGDLNHSLR